MPISPTGSPNWRSPAPSASARSRATPPPPISSTAWRTRRWDGRSPPSPRISGRSRRSPTTSSWCARARASSSGNSACPRLVDLAQLEERAGNPAGAVAAYRRALARAPTNPTLLNNLAYLLTADPESRDEAVALAEKALAQAPTSAAIADTLGWALYQKGELDRAEVLLSRVAKAAPAAGEVRYHLGMVYAKQGKTEEARRELEAAVQAGNFKSLAEARQALESLK
jgi:tetratricopeptide (TPR) repeat protein